MTETKLPKFDPKAKCVKCGWSIPDPVAPAPKFISGASGPPGAEKPKKESAAEPAKPAAKPATPAEPKGFLHQDPAPAPQPPKVEYCNGSDCPWDDGEGHVAEHMHQWCEVCGYEWLSLPLG